MSDQNQQGGGSGTDQGTEQGQQGTGQENQDQGQQGGAGAGTGTETVSRADHEKELDRYRNQVGQEKKRADDMAARVKALEDAGKSEADRLAEKARQADELQPRVAKLEAAAKGQLEALKAQLPAEVAELMPEGDVADQLAWTQKAVAAAAKLSGGAGGAGSGSELPPAGDRNPAGGSTDTNAKLKFDKTRAQYGAMRGRIVRPDA